VFYVVGMDRASTIEHWRLSLLAELLKLCAEIGLNGGGTLERVPKPVHRYALRILRTVESAARRLILAAARDIVVEPPPERVPRQAKPRQKPSAEPRADAEGKPRRKRKPLFNLFDALRRVGRRFGRKKHRGPEPRIHFLAAPDPRIPEFLRSPAPPPPPVAEKKIDDGMVSARNLVRRLVAAADALNDIPGHARRLAQWQARPKEDRRPERWGPLRSGRPPGFRQKAKHVVDDILKECHWLAIQGHPPLDDTS
jgi:hypothetical protein